MTDGFDTVTALLDYPMYVVTTTADGTHAGCLVGFATQVSIDPPRYLVGLSVNNRTFRVASRAPRLVVHLVDSADHALAERFGAETGDDTDKFGPDDWTPGPDGVPVLDAAVAWFSGPIRSSVDLGDHTGFLLDVDSAEVRRHPKRLLSFHDVQDLEPGHEA